MSLHSMEEYRRALRFVKDIEKALKIINAAEASLKNYERYRPIRTILTTISTEKTFLNIFLEQNRIILATKGEKRRI